MGDAKVNRDRECMPGHGVCSLLRIFGIQRPEPVDKIDRQHKQYDRICLVQKSYPNIHIR